jgi:hypothetical protein
MDNLWRDPHDYGEGEKQKIINTESRGVTFTLLLCIFIFI